MPEVIIYGASDDLVEFEGYIKDEFNCYGKWKGKLVAPNGQSLDILAEFGGSSLSDWTLAVRNRSFPPPDWPIRFGERPGYGGDPAIIIDVPQDTVVVPPKERDD